VVSRKRDALSSGRGHPATYRARATLRCSLMRAGRALGQFIHSRTGSGRNCCSTCGGGGPGDFQTAGDRVTALPVPKLLSSPGPALDAGRFRSSPHVLFAGAVGFAEGVAPANERTVSSSFIAMRAKVSRISLAAATGSGLPFGPCGLTR